MKGKVNRKKGKVKCDRWDKKREGRKKGNEEKIIMEG